MTAGILRGVLSFSGPLRFTEHREHDGERCWREACDKGWEGVIAERADARYRGGRGRDWLKFKCENAQEFVIGGFTEPQGSRAGQLRHPRFQGPRRDKDPADVVREVPS